jgi:FkbM family methyltransferase
MKRLVNLFFINFLHNKFNCNKSYEKLFLGNQYGGWTICPTTINNTSIVYSFGVGEDISFDKAIIDQFGVVVYAFDPTPKSIDWINGQDLPERFHFYDFGIGSSDRLSKFYPPQNPNHVSHSIIKKSRKKPSEPITVQLHRLETIMKMLDHDNVSILKMDIEGAEYEVIDDLYHSSNLDISQILVEFHHFLPGITYRKTRNAIKKLNKCGYSLFNISKRGYEYSFIRS